MNNENNLETQEKIFSLGINSITKALNMIETEEIQ